ncbi:uncharacterized protein [Eurosta solidaginis]|uniref:uncharacterized protein n=1 Tax=Eurosta solidaginis TaxID=178769 RepID=UPI003530FEFC
MNSNYLLRVLLYCLLYFDSALLVRMWDMAYNKHLLCESGKVIKVQNINWFISEQMKTNQSDGVGQLLEAVHTCLGVTQTISTKCTDTPFMPLDISLNVIFITSPADPIFDVHNCSTMRRQLYGVLMIMVNVVNDFEVMEQFISLFHKDYLTDTAIYYYSAKNQTNVVLGYKSYKLKFENRTDRFSDLIQAKQHFANGAVNLKGFNLYSPLRLDFPHVFPFKNNGTYVTFKGISYNFMRTFAEYINGTIVNYEMPKDQLGGNVIDMKAALELVRRGKVTYLVNPYALYQEDDELTKSYPLMVVDWCLMVPVWNSISTKYYLMKPFSTATWLNIVLVFFALLAIKCLHYCWRGTHHLATHLSDYILHSFCLSIGIALPRFVRSAPNVRDFLLFTTICAYGFFLQANYTSLLGSIFTVNLFRAQINTMDDFVNANFAVLIIDYELEFLRSINESYKLPYNFSRLIVPVDAATYNKHITEFNTSFAFFVTSEKWRLLALQQQHLKEKLFKLSDICFGSYQLTFPIPFNSPLHWNLHIFLLHMHNSGILEHFAATLFNQARHAGLVKYFTGDSENITAGMEHLVVVFYLLLFIYFISSLIFLGELLTHRLKLNRIFKSRQRE